VEGVNQVLDAFFRVIPGSFMVWRRWSRRVYRLWRRYVLSGR